MASSAASAASAAASSAASAASAAAGGFCCGRLRVRRLLFARLLLYYGFLCFDVCGVNVSVDDI
jgi:hypothetical protein